MFQSKIVFNNRFCLAIFLTPSAKIIDTKVLKPSGTAATANEIAAAKAAGQVDSILPTPFKII